MAENLATLIRKRGPIQRIGVIGMGYVGIPAAALFADVPGVEHVYGFQRDSASSGYKIVHRRQVKTAIATLHTPP